MDMEGLRHAVEYGKRFKHSTLVVSLPLLEELLTAHAAAPKLLEACRLALGYLAGIKALPADALINETIRAAIAAARPPGTPGDSPNDPRDL